MTTSVVLSPHLDDAVLSAWHLINRPRTEVITVFAGIPPIGTATTWDKLCGESDSSVMMDKRLKENEKALKYSTSSWHNLNYLDKQYASLSYTPEEIANEISSQFKGDVHFFAPLSGGKLRHHHDHVLLRQVGQLLLNRGRKVEFYADVPYMQMPLLLNNRYKKAVAKRASTLLGMNMTVEIYTLSPSQLERKYKAMAAYKSQYKMTNLVSLGTLTRKANIKQEVVFVHRRNP